MKRLKTKSGIYMILNLKTDERYVGGTTRPINQRWAEHKSHLSAGKLHPDHPLQEAWNKFDSDAFRLIILENTPPDLDIVHEREQHWMDHFKEQGCKLYNRCPSAFDNSGLVMPDDSFEDHGELMKRFWEENPDKKQAMAQKMRKVWENNPQKKEKMIQKQKELWQDPERRKQMLANRNYSGPYAFLSPDGKEHHVEVLSQFCREHDLDPSTMSKIHREVNGKKSHKGWTKA